MSISAPLGSALYAAAVVPGMLSPCGGLLLLLGYFQPLGNPGVRIPAVVGGQGLGHLLSAEPVAHPRGTVRPPGMAGARPASRATGLMGMQRLLSEGKIQALLTQKGLRGSTKGADAR